jgi:hypothetical protein
MASMTECLSWQSRSSKPTGRRNRRTWG